MMKMEFRVDEKRGKESKFTGDYKRGNDCYEMLFDVCERNY